MQGTIRMDRKITYIDAKCILILLTPNCINQYLIPLLSRGLHLTKRMMWAILNMVLNKPTSKTCT